jgi:hypothetical protein
MLRFLGPLDDDPVEVMPKFLSDSYAIAGGGAAPAFNCSCCGKTRKKTRTRKMKIFSLSFFLLFYYDDYIAPGYSLAAREI